MIDNLLDDENNFKKTYDREGWISITESVDDDDDDDEEEEDDDEDDRSRRVGCSYE